MRADKKADYGTVARVMGQLSGAGFKRLALVGMMLIVAPTAWLIVRRDVRAALNRG